MKIILLLILNFFNRIIFQKLKLLEELLRLNLEGSKGYPLKGDPSASQAFLKISYYFSSSVVGNPIYFLYYSYIIFLRAPFIKIIQI